MNDVTNGSSKLTMTAITRTCDINTYGFLLVFSCMHNVYVCMYIYIYMSILCEKHICRFFIKSIGRLVSRHKPGTLRYHCAHGARGAARQTDRRLLCNRLSCFLLVYSTPFVLYSSPWHFIYFFFFLRKRQTIGE